VDVLEVTEARDRLAELLNRAASGRERFLIRRRGKPVAAIVSSEDLEHLERDTSAPTGLAALAGLMADIPDWESVMTVTLNSRQSRPDREVCIG